MLQQCPRQNRQLHIKHEINLTLEPKTPLLY